MLVVSMGYQSTSPSKGCLKTLSRVLGSFWPLRKCLQHRPEHECQFSLGALPSSRDECPLRLPVEALAFNQALAELEWIQVMFRDVVHGDVPIELIGPLLFSPLFESTRKSSELHGILSSEDRLQQCGITDAKSPLRLLEEREPCFKTR